MTARQEVLALAEKLGVTVEVGQGRDFSVELTAPAGRVFAANFTHTAVCVAFHEPASVAWKLALDDLKAGLDDCSEPECDSCQPENNP